MVNLKNEYNYNSKDYETAFWNAMKSKNVESEVLLSAKDTMSSTFALPPKDNEGFKKEMNKLSIFRNIATVLTVDSAYDIYAHDNFDSAHWVSETENIDPTEIASDFNKVSIKNHKLSILAKVSNSFMEDSKFDFKKYLIKRLSRNFVNAEDEAFTNGDGVKTPIGILDKENGVTISFKVNAITYEDVVKLYFSVNKEYRNNGVWMMNDETALLVRTLKDGDGNYIFNQDNETILGKTVIINNAMPSVKSGSAPIVFGDFSFYWIVERQIAGLRPLTELYSLEDQTGYLANEYLDAKLVRKEAIKGIEIE